MLKQNLLLAFTLTFLMSINLFAQKENVNFTNGAKLEKQTFAEENKTRMFELKASYPKIIGADSTITNIFNQRVRSLVIGELNEFKKHMLEQAAEELKFAKERGVTNYSEINYSVELANDKVISIWFGNSTYSGGAHPNSHSFTFNFDLEKGKELKLNDLFQPDSGYLKRISSYSVADLKRQQSDYSDNDWISRGAGPTAKNFNSWNITKTGLRFNFDPYQVAAYVAGPQSVTISFGTLKDIFKALNFEPLQSAVYVDGNPPNWCRNGHFPRESVEFKLARVTGKRRSKAYFHGDGDDCPGGKNCRKKSYVISGDQLIVSRKYGNKVCSWFQPKKGDETVGWILTDRLDVYSPNEKPLLNKWLGKWASNGDSLNITRSKKAGVLKIKGNAFWRGLGDNIHIGEVDNVGIPSGNFLEVGGKEEYDCHVKMQLVGDLLVVSDNMKCGGVNVTFSGVYRKK